MKKVLIIVYYWPPSGGAGVQRWLKFVKYLPEFGWDPIVYTPSNPDFKLQDESLLKDVDPNLKVIKKKIWEPYGIYRNLFAKKKDQQLSTGIKGKSNWKSNLANWIRGNLFIPDPKVFWRKPSVEFLRQYIKENKIDAVISSGTPHSMHLIALDLKKEFKIPWIADFRDPWTELDMLDDYHIMPSKMKKYREMEKEVLHHADVALTTSKVWAEDFKRLGAKKSVCITNGYDESDFPNSVEPYQEFVVSHFGLLNHLRNPSTLWKVLEEILSSNDEFASKFKLHLGGTIDSKVLEEIKEYPNLNSRLKLFPYISHTEVIEEYKKSSILLLLLFNSKSGKGNIPGKLFEYLAAKKPILGFGPDRGDSAEIVESTQGFYQNYSQEDTEPLKEWILKCFSNPKASEIETEQYSRKNLTKSLAVLLNELGD